MSELKHVGRVKSTNKKCLVAYRTLPGDAYYCLIVPTENLPDAYHDALINLVESHAGQDAYEFAEAMDRTQFPDGSRMLPALHASGRLIKISTDAVEMTPTLSQSITLSELNQIIAEQRGVPIDELSVQPSLAEGKRTRDLGEPVAAEEVKTATAPVTATIELTPEAQAKEYRSKADKLAKEAAAFRRMAEELAPTKKK
jgi:hypothetical protein